MLEAMRRFLYSKWFFLLLATVCAIDLAADLGKEIWGHNFLNSIAVGMDSLPSPSLCGSSQTYTYEGQSMATILVVEDEPAIRQLIYEILRAAGHTVITAANGFEGIAFFRSNPDQYDLLLTNLQMPVMNGQEFVKLARDECQHEDHLHDRLHG